MLQTGFNNELYLEKQSEKIMERIAKFSGKLYLEFGGKLFDDMHASRVLPGFDPNVKTKLLQKMKDKLEIIFCISAGDIERNKIRADFGITYGADVLRLMDNLRALGVLINSVVITQYTEQPAATIFKNKLQMRGEKVYIHKHTKGYPNDVDTIVSDEGYGANPYIETTRPLVVVTAPGPGSGKLATCLSQLYHEYKRGIAAGYAKYETFPVWNMPLKHPLNIAYEAATADLKDFNMIDSFHLDAYGITTVNYNRDIDIFPVVKNILTKITGDADLYKSPTDMGVNMVGYAITDDDVVREASKQEIIRRFYKTWCDYKQGMVDIDTAHRVEIIMKSIGASAEDRPVVRVAKEKSVKSASPSMALQLRDGTMISARTTNFVTASAGVILNSIKKLAAIADRIKLIAPIAIEPIMNMKKHVLHAKSTILNIEEALIALSISAATNPTVEYVMTKLEELKGCEAHSTVILNENEEQILGKLGISVTCEPEFAGTDLYNK